MQSNKPRFKHFQRIPLLLALPMMANLNACHPYQRLQSSQLIAESNGRARYHMTGYGEIGEFDDHASIRQIEFALSDACPAGVTIVRLQEERVAPLGMEMLHWDTIAECK